MRLTHCALAVALMLCPSFVAAGPAGALDPSFGTDGKRTLALPGHHDIEVPFTLRDSAGRIYLITSVNNGNWDHALYVTRLHHDGSVDAGYGEMGTVTHPLHSPLHGVTAAAMQGDGRIVLGFSATGGAGIKTCRLLRDGSFDPGFGNAFTQGCGEIGPDLSEADAIAIQPDGRIVLAGEKTNFRGFVARLEPDGSPDTGFGEDGVVLLGAGGKTAFNTVAFTPNGDVLAAGSIDLSGKDFLLLKLSGTDGKPVPSFGTWGLVAIAFDVGGPDHDNAYGLKVLPDGNIVVAGTAQTNDDNVIPAVARLTGTGVPDENFGPDGKRVHDPCAAYEGPSCLAWTRDLAVLPDGRIVLAGTFPIAPDQTAFFAMRLLANGEADPAFGNDPVVPGFVTVPFKFAPNEGYSEAYALYLEGERVLLAGKAVVNTGEEEPSLRTDFALARLDHGLNAAFAVTPKPGPHGALSPASVQQVGHSNYAEFVVLPDPGYLFHRMEKGPGYCNGGMDGDVFVSAPVTQPCEVHVSFQRSLVFSDSYE